MNSFIDSLNQWGGDFLRFAPPMLWQSSLLILVVCAVDFLSRNKIRASIRYALWLVVLVKLCLPPTLAFPTGAAWWLFPGHAAAHPLATPQYTVTYDNATMLSDFVPAAVPAFIPPATKLTAAGWTLFGCGIVSVTLLLCLALRWWQISQKISRAVPAEGFTDLLEEIRSRIGSRAVLQLRLVDGRMSPAVCGLFRPVILLPRALAQQLSRRQLRAVLLHEAIHLRRKDVSVNCVQALVQNVYWWHPLVWLANARIRRVREEAVDDAVMLALRDEGDTYAPTLLEVARLAFSRPLMSLGLVGIMESRSALRKRIERLVNFRAPRKAGLTFLSLCGILVFSAVALPMGEAPAPAEKSNPTDATPVAQQSLTLKVNPAVFIKNVQAQAAQSLLWPTNDYTDILLELLRTEGVDCTPPNRIAFNTSTGEITTQNAPDKLEIFRQVMEQLNRADGHCALPLSDNPLRKRLVAIEARLYQMPSADFDKFVSGLRYYHHRQYGDDWWLASPEQFKQLIENLESSGLPLIQRPRILTGSGITAELFVGNGTNSVEFDCKPYVADGFVDLTLRGTVARDAPVSAAFTNYFSTEASAENHGGIVVRVKNYGGDVGNNLVAAIGVEMVTNTARFQQRLQAIINRPDSPAPAANTSGQSQVTPDAAKPGTSTGFVERVRVAIHHDGSATAGDPPAAALRNRSFKLNHPISKDELEKALIAAGVTTPPTTYFLTDGGIIVAHGSESQLARVSQIRLKLNGFSPKEIKDGDAASIEYPVEAVATTENVTNLFSRTFKVDKYAFANALRNIPDLDTNGISAIAKSLFGKLGVDWETPKGKAVFYDDRLSLLFVRATLSDFDTVEQALQALIYFTPQIHIKARFIELPGSAVGDVYLGSINVNAASDPVLIRESAYFSRNRPDQLTGIMTESQFLTAFQVIQHNPGFEVLAEPEGTTTSGRQMQMRSTQVFTVITNFSYQQISNVTAIFPQTNAVETGPILDTVATVRADSYTIDLKTTASVMEFLGYDKSTNTAVAYNSAGQKINLPTILPSFAVRKASADITMYDGQTAILGAMKPDYFLKAKAARSQPNEKDKELLVFITVTLVDPAGNRIHSDDEVPFARNSIPQQSDP